MKIAFYVHYTNLKAGGIFTYTMGILKLLAASGEIEKIFLIHSGSQRKYFEENFNYPKVRLIEIDRRSKLNNFLLGISYFLFDTYFIYSGYLSNPSKLNFLIKLSRFFNPYKKIDSLDADIFHVPLQFSPIYGINKPMLITMHDVQELHFPENFDSRERLHRAVNSKKAIDNADHIIVSFNHIKNDLIKYFNIKEGGVSVCPPPFSENWFITDSYTPLDELKIKYNLEGDYILYPAATWVHKNHTLLLKVITRLKQKGKDIKLVCTGSKTDYYNLLAAEAERLNVQDRVKFLGIVPEEDLIGLYHSARLVVIPTLYEAGSGPLYEAMRYNIPVICSNVTSLPDTMENDEFVFDPADIEEITNLVEKGLYDNEFRERNISNSKRRIKFYSGLEYSSAFIDAYKKAIEAKRAAIA